VTLNIDTTSQQYQNLLAGIDTLETQLAERWPMFRRLPRAQKVVWLQRDPLLRRALRFVDDHADRVGDLREEL
jgi:hypothetical protein